MTEQEAKEKWCPMIRFQIGPDNAAWQGVAYTNRGEEMRPPESVRCIASECMMWRWSIVGATVNGVYDDNYPVEGYCGLGGKP
jgi:hypothetical protein